ncbi:amidophosphoribosyltransferase, chloroplastic-like, partial [Olea europaea subsp. europaea]
MAATATSTPTVKPPVFFSSITRLCSLSPTSHDFNKLLSNLLKTIPKPLQITYSKNPLSDVIRETTKNSDDNSLNFNDDDDKPREECGVVGIYGDPEASRLCYLALHALQHRGQEGAGIVSVHDNVLQSVTGVGLVSDVFSESKMDKLPGDMAIGHVRYSTAGSSMLKN